MKIKVNAYIAYRLGIKFIRSVENEIWIDLIDLDKEQLKTLKEEFKKISYDIKVKVSDRLIKKVIKNKSDKEKIEFLLWIKKINLNDLNIITIIQPYLYEIGTIKVRINNITFYKDMYKLIYLDRTTNETDS
jgi:predicted DNA binding CopG/RHH family protein